MLHILRWLCWGVMVYICAEAAAVITLSTVERVWLVPYPPDRLNRISGKTAETIQRLLADEPTFIRHDAVLGWTLRPDARTGTYTINSQGIRSDRPYTAESSADSVRIICCGDSYTFSSHVRNDETWPAVLARNNAGVETLNFGVPGFGLDQAILRYEQDTGEFESDISLLGFMPENIHRCLSVFRLFYVPYDSGLPFAKPRFVLDDDSLRMVANPMPNLADYSRLLSAPEEVLPELARFDRFNPAPAHRSATDVLPSARFLHSCLYGFSRPQLPPEQYTYDTASEGFNIAIRLFDRFHRAAVARGSEPVIVILPESADFRQLNDTGTRRYTSLLGYFERKGYPYIDVQNGFTSLGRNLTEDEVFRRGHYTPAGNEIVARYVAERLMEMGMIPGGPMTSAR